MKNNSAIYLFKGILLLILDIITLRIIFSVWALVNITLFPWALLAIIFSLLALNIVVIVSEYGVEKFSLGSYVSTLLSTIIYYLFIMTFTGLTYIIISPKWYIIMTLIISMIYFATVFGLYIAGINKNKDMIKQKLEQESGIDITLHLININDNIKKCSNFIEESYYKLVIEAFNDMEERLKSSTPFGRTVKPIVKNLEKQISEKLYQLNKDLILLKTDDNGTNFNSIISSLADVKSLVVNREKLIIK